MEHKLLKNCKKFSLLFITLLLASTLFAINAQASTKPSLNGTQLAWWYSGGAGWYDYGASQPYSVYYEPRGNRYYWTPWEMLPNGCKRTCLVNRFSGQVMRCAKKCI